MKKPLPKLATSLAALVGIARKENDVARIEAALAEARNQVETAVADFDRAQSSYTAGLLDASAADLEKLVAAKGSASIRKDQAAALIEALTARLAMTREADGKAKRKAIHDEARAKSVAVRARLAPEYQRLCLGLRDLMRDFYDAEVAVADANKFGAEFGFLDSIEYDLRNLNSTPEEIVEEIEIEAWAIDGRREPLPEDDQKRVGVHGNRPNKGTLHPKQSSAYTTVGGHFDCTKRRFRRVTYRPFTPGPDIGRLSTVLRLPGFEAGAGDFYRGSPEYDAGSALRELNTEMAQPTPRRTARPTQVRWEQVVEPDPAAPAARLIHAQDRSNLRDETAAA